MRRLAWVLILLGGCARTTSPATGPAIQSIGGPGSDAGRFATPRATAWDPRGYLYVVDKTGRIQKFDAAGRFLTGWATPENEKGRPTGVMVDPKGDVWVADTHYHRILHYSGDGALLSEFGREGTGPGQFLYPTGIAMDGDGLLYVSEYGGNDRIQVLTTEGKAVRAWGKYGSEPGEFQRPQSLALGGGRVYVADAAGHRIQVFGQDGRFLAAWGDLKYPYSVAFDADGNLLVAEYGRHRIAKFTTEGKPLALAGQPGTGPSDLHTPWSAIPISGDRIAVVDSGNHRVQLWPSTLLRGGP